MPPKGLRWTRTPPCQAQLVLEEKFQKNIFTEETQVTHAYVQDDEFQKYSLEVFRKAFFETRNKFGLERKHFL